jgi:hypothetical protein
MARALLLVDFGWIARVRGVQALNINFASDRFAA